MKCMSQKQCHIGSWSIFISIPFIVWGCWGWGGGWVNFFGNYDLLCPWALPWCGSHSKESTWNAGDLGSIPGLGKSLGKGHGNPLQYSCLENPHGQRSLAGYSPWGRKESDMTERPNWLNWNPFIKLKRWLEKVCIYNKIYQIKGFLCP